MGTIRFEAYMTLSRMMLMPKNLEEEQAEMHGQVRRGKKLGQRASDAHRGRTRKQDIPSRDEAIPPRIWPRLLKRKASLDRGAIARMRITRPDMTLIQIAEHFRCSRASVVDAIREIAEYTCKGKGCGKGIRRRRKYCAECRRQVESEARRRDARARGVRPREDYLTQSKLSAMADPIAKMCTDRLDLSNAEIAEHFGCSLMYVGRACQLRGIKRRELRKAAGSSRRKASAAE